MAEKITLGLCTSGSRLKVSVFDGCRFLHTQKKVYNQERALFGVLGRELGKAGSDLRGVKQVCAVRGPGRFTGIRISLTLAGTLKALSGAAVYTATLFEVLALQAAESAGFNKNAAGKGRRLAVLLHAFKDEYFCQFFLAVPGRLPSAESDPVWLKEPEMRALLSGKGRELYVIADSEEAPGIYALVPEKAEKAAAALSKVLPAYIIKAALAYKNKTLKPLYLKPAKYELENNISTKAREQESRKARKLEGKKR